MLTTQEAAARLGVTSIRVRQLISDGRLPAEKFGRDYMIKEEDLKLVKDRKPGRPRKSAEVQTGQKRASKKGEQEG